MKAIMVNYSIDSGEHRGTEIRITLKNWGDDPKEMAEFLYFIQSKENIFSDETLTQYLMTKKISK